MIKIEKGYCVCCDDCGEDFEELNVIILEEEEEEDVYLYDDCLQELNRKIVERLAKKNL